MMVSDFRDILSFVRNERAHIEGDIYVGSKFLITRNCNSFFKPLLDNNGSVLKPSCKSILLNTQFHKPI